MPVLLVIHGPIATHILNVDSTSVAALAVDIKVPRQVLTAARGHEQDPGGCLGVSERALLVVGAELALETLPVQVGFRPVIGA